MGALLMAMNWWMAHRRGFGTEEAVPLRDLPRVTTRAFPALMMPAILLYGIYGRITTPTEAAAIAAAYALVVSVLLYRALKLRTLYAILVDSARASAAVGIVIGASLILNYIIASENIPAVLVAALAALIFLPGIVLFLPRLFGYKG